MDSAASRGRPTLFNSRYRVLKGLRNAIEEAKEEVFIDQASGDQLVILDYGCADQPYRFLFEEHGIRYIAADLPGNESADLEIDSSGRVPLSDVSVDVVLSTQVLEHVADPSGYLQEAHRVLRPGGRLILSTHGYWKFHPDPNDYCRWTSQGLVSLINSNNFCVDECRGILALAPTGLQLFQDGIFRACVRRRLYVISKLLTPVFQIAITIIDRLSSRHERDRDAAVYVITATRDG